MSDGHYSAPESDPQYAAGGATDIELAAAVAAVDAALAAKQDASTAATDAELTAAVATLNTTLSGKQDASTAATDAEVTAAIAAHAAGDATDAELAAAVASLTSSIALKQDAATAATDAELSAALALKQDKATSGRIGAAEITSASSVTGQTLADGSVPLYCTNVAVTETTEAEVRFFCPFFYMQNDQDQGSLALYKAVHGGAYSQIGAGFAIAPKAAGGGALFVSAPTQLTAGAYDFKIMFANTTSAVRTANILADTGSVFGKATLGVWRAAS